MQFLNLFVGELPLITPHGDWELRPRRDFRRSRNLLITPHGDWELWASPCAPGPGSLSLPLMGIGNLA